MVGTVGLSEGSQTTGHAGDNLEKTPGTVPLIIDNIVVRILTSSYRVIGSPCNKPGRPDNGGLEDQGCLYIVVRSVGEPRGIILIVDIDASTIDQIGVNCGITSIAGMLCPGSTDLASVVLEKYTVSIRKSI